MDFLGIIEDFKRKIRELKQENAELLYENNRLKERLRLNSTNSSLPPSRDLYKVNQKNRLGSGRKPGRQLGHKPQGYQMKAPDEIINVFPDCCACDHQVEIGQTFKLNGAGAGFRSLSEPWVYTTSRIQAVWL